MSNFLIPALRALAPYTPGEQPQDKRYVKLNTNESPFPPSPRVLDALGREQTALLNLYSDPSIAPLKRAIAEAYGVKREQVFVGNGSDEVLAFAFLAYTDAEHPAVLPDISYGLYQVYCGLFRADPAVVPLDAAYRLPVEAFFGAGGMVAFANPNAPTGIALGLGDVERIVSANPDHVVLVDEAYVDFGAETALPLLKRYPNLLIVRTFSKSRSLAGARLGYAMGGEALIDDLERVRGSFHPYNVNRLSMLAGVEAMRDTAYFEQCRQAIMRQREESANELRGLGFTMTDSLANFLFVSHPALAAREYYERLKQKGVLVRYFNQPRIDGHVRITVGSKEQMRQLALRTREILKEVGA